MLDNWSTNEKIVAFLVIGAIVAVFIHLMQKSSSSTSTKFTPVRKGYVARISMPSSIPSLGEDVYARKCNCRGAPNCQCGTDPERAKQMIERQREKKASFSSGGSRIVQNIRNKNKRPEHQAAAHMTANTDDGHEDGDYMEYVKSKSISPEAVDVHKTYLAERKMYSQQPAIPSDVIESNYGNFWGFGRRTYKAPAPDARQQFGANDEDYDPKWGRTYSF